MQLFKLHTQPRGRPVKSAATQSHQQPHARNVLQALYAMQRITQSQHRAGLMFKQLAINAYSHMGGPTLASGAQRRGSTATRCDQFGEWKNLLAHITQLHGRTQIDTLVASLIEDQPPPGILYDTGLDQASIKAFCSTLDTIAQVLETSLRYKYDPTPCTVPREKG